MPKVRPEWLEAIRDSPDVINVLDSDEEAEHIHPSHKDPMYAHQIGPACRALHEEATHTMKSGAAMLPGGGTTEALKTRKSETALIRVVPKDINASMQSIKLMDNGRDVDSQGTLASSPTEISEHATSAISSLSCSGNGCSSAPVHAQQGKREKNPRIWRSKDPRPRATVDNREMVAEYQPQTVSKIICNTRGVLDDTACQKPPIKQRAVNCGA